MNNPCKNFLLIDSFHYPQSDPNSIFLILIDTDRYNYYYHSYYHFRTDYTITESSKILNYFFFVKFYYFYVIRWSIWVISPNWRINLTVGVNVLIPVNWWTTIFSTTSRFTFFSLIIAYLKILSLNKTFQQKNIIWLIMYASYYRVF